MVPVTAGEGGILEAVQRGNLEQCEHLIQLDRSVLKQKGWGGFTALHFAALHGNRAVGDLLLDSEADPNLPCDSGQTPFHFACRHGNVYTMHKMLQHGADLHIRDHQGKSAMHHAACGGSLISMQYLADSGMFQFSDTDQFLLTPLHLAATIGNVDVVRYLLRNNRCAAEAVDQQGATALHVAAERGCVEVCWVLLQNAGLGLLHAETHNGHTPLDIASRGNSYRHQELSKLLSKYANKPADYKPSNSYGIYYWTLLLPSLSGGVVLIVATAMGEYGGVVCGLLFPLLARSTLTQYHRISTYQRFPNPVYLGTLSAGILHSIICIFYKILPSVWPSGLLLHVCVLHCSALLLLYWTLLRRDPGRMAASTSDPRYTSIADLLHHQQSPQHFCTTCELFQVDNSKHCRLCDVCVLNYDHHCLFLNRCVGRGNHRLFLLFLIAMAISHILFLAVGGLYMKPLLWAEPVTTVIGREAWVVVLCVLNALTLLWELWLLNEQFQVVAMGTTTYFRRAPAVALSRKERWRNVLFFLLEGRIPRTGRAGTHMV
ncbi:putative ZDHHC-type palmitoyltransferase 6 isoform X2 [Sardina pilchardus]|uniref:putative ZDHHC-type palmitoyltransferase 6 isoform X2 n=1 Tax=Sardina pilchardus TaxID=27697 RepID=UPI002E1490E7